MPTASRKSGYHERAGRCRSKRRQIFQHSSKPMPRVAAPKLERSRDRGVCTRNDRRTGNGIGRTGDSRVHAITIIMVAARVPNRADHEPLLAWDENQQLGTARPHWRGRRHHCSSLPAEPCHSASLYGSPASPCPVPLNVNERPHSLLSSAGEWSRPAAQRVSEVLDIDIHRRVPTVKPAGPRSRRDQRSQPRSTFGRRPQLD